MKALFILFAGLGLSASTSFGQTQSSINSTFNGTPIAGGRYIWLHSHIDLSNHPSTDFSISTTGSTVNWTKNGTTVNVAIPNAVVNFSHAATTESYDYTGSSWNITIPWSEINNGEIFIGGAAYLVPPGGQAGGVNPVTYTHNFSSTAPGVSFQWQWSAAVYTNFTTTYNNLNVQILHNTLHAGTPNAFKQFVTGGARGGGGSNYTGSWSSTQSVGSVALDLSLLSFSAAARQSDVVLNWQTSPGERITSFDVERSADGQVWKAISRIAAGTQVTYSAVDKSPIAGTSFYRLQMRRQDGSTEFSAVEKVTFELAKGKLQVYPNPASETLFIGFAGKIIGGMVYNMLGMSMRTISTDQKAIDVRSLPPGHYMISLYTNQGLEKIRFSKSQ